MAGVQRRAAGRPHRVPARLPGLGPVGPIFHQDGAVAGDLRAAGRRHAEWGTPSRDRKPCVWAEGALRGFPQSMTATERRARASTSAVFRPPVPPPVTMTSYEVRLAVPFAAPVMAIPSAAGLRRGTRPGRFPVPFPERGGPASPRPTTQAPARSPHAPRTGHCLRRPTPRPAAPDRPAAWSSARRRAARTGEGVGTASGLPVSAPSRAGATSWRDMPNTSTGPRWAVGCPATATPACRSGGTPVRRPTRPPHGQGAAQPSCPPPTPGACRAGETNCRRGSGAHSRMRPRCSGRGEEARELPPPFTVVTRTGQPCGPGGGRTRRPLARGRVRPGPGEGTGGRETPAGLRQRRPPWRGGRTLTGGAPGRTRTCGQVLRRHLLYPLSYGGRSWSGWDGGPSVTSPGTG